MAYRNRGDIGMASVKVDMQPVAKILSNRNLMQMQAAQKAIDATCLRLNAQYMRIDTGANIASGMASSVIGSGKIRYTRHYSAYDYYPTKYNHGIGTAAGALRGDYHFKRMVAAHKKEILDAACAASGGRPG